MTALQILFLVVGFITFLAALMVVVSPKLIHSGLWLILALAGVASVFVLLEAPFLAVVQVVIYIGAIAILIIFAIMLTRRVMEDVGPQVNRMWWAGALAGLLLFVLLTALIVASPNLAQTAEPLAQESNVILQDLGRSLVDVNRFVLPFEMASVLLLAALIGAIMIARPVVAIDEDEQA